jgi:CheY-like chemotaxis protein
MPRVPAAEGRLVQLFVNLLLNAAQALPERDLSLNSVHVAGGTVAGYGVAWVEVRDSGVGLAADVLPRIFEPFFTTRAVGRGMGLGLSVCHGIVRSLGGEITVRSQPGHGATFRVTLRTASETLDDAGMARAPPARILVVDGEPFIGAAVQRMLGDVHEVHAHTRAEDALTTLAKGARYDVILCEIRMPDASGNEFLERLEALAPDQRRAVVFMSGGGAEEAEQRPRAGQGRLLPKPLEGARLRALLDEMRLRGDA